MYYENYNKNFIEIEDFGDNSIYKILKRKKIKRFIYFKNVIELLCRLQRIRNRKVKNFKRNTYIIPKYDKKILIKEANLFCNWYIDNKLPKNERIIFVKEFKKIITVLTNNLKLKNNVFVHRDFHASNLMLVKERIGLIDSQDAVIGNRAYDLASLVDDVRLKTSESLKERIFNLYLRKQKRLNKKKFKNDFYILSVLRNLKILGIFVRLAKRDKKKKYMKLIPYCWKLIENRVQNDEIFGDFRSFLKKKEFEKFIKIK